MLKHRRKSIRSSISPPREPRMQAHPGKRLSKKSFEELLRVRKLSSMPRDPERFELCLSDCSVY
jgi:hypothetical protein